MGLNVESSTFRLPPRRPRIHRLFVLFREDVRQRLAQGGLAGLDLEDELQNVFDIAIRRYSRVPLDDGEAKKWLLEVAHKRASNWTKLHRHRSLGLLRAASSLKLPVTDDSDPETHLAEVVLVRDAASYLSQEDQEILFRRFAFRESLTAIAKRFGISKSTAHVRVKEVRTLFVEKLARVSEVRKKSYSLFPPLLLLSALLRNKASFSAILSRFPFLGRMGESAFWSLQLAPVVLGPTLGIVLGLSLPKQEMYSEPEPSRVVPKTMPHVLLPMPPPLPVAVAPLPVVVAPPPPLPPPPPPSAPVAVASVKVPSAHVSDIDPAEESSYQAIKACWETCVPEIALALILKYQTAFPTGKHYHEVSTLQRLWMVRDAQEEKPPPKHRR